MTAAAGGRRRLHRRRRPDGAGAGRRRDRRRPISWVGDPWQVPPGAGTEVRRLGGLLMPGLVNCHGHSPMTLLRSAGDGLPLDRWLHEAVWPREAMLEDEDVYWGMVLGAVELLGNGVTTTCEQYRHPDADGRCRARRGHPHRLHAGDLRRARRRSGQQLGGAAGRHVRGRRRRRRGSTSRLQMGFGPHAAYTVPPEGLARRSRPKPGRAMRCCRSTSPRRRPRAQVVQERYGMSAPALLAAEGVLEGRVLAAHAVWLDDADLDAARRARRGRGPLPGLQREAGLGHRPAARAARPRRAGRTRAPTARPPTTTSTCGTSCGWPRSSPGPPPAIPTS